MAARRKGGSGRCRGAPGRGSGKGPKKRAAFKKASARKRATSKKTSARKRATSKKTSARKRAASKKTSARKRAASEKTSARKRAASEKTSARKRRATRKTSTRKRPVAPTRADRSSPSQPSTRTSQRRRIVEAFPVPVGQVSHYFAAVGVAEIALHAELRRGDTVHFQGHTTDFLQRVVRLEQQDTAVPSASPGESVGLAVEQRVRPGDRVYRLSY